MKGILTTPNDKCPLCTHIAHEKINALLLNPEKNMSFPAIQMWLKQHYPTETIPSIHTIRNHKNRHIQLENEYLDAVRELSIDRRTGTLVTKRGQTIETVGIVAAIKTIVTVGIANILRDPSTVSPQHTLEALKMLKSLGIDDDDPTMMTWQATVMQPNGRPPTGAEYLDAITEVRELSDNEQSEETALPPLPEYDESKN